VTLGLAAVVVIYVLLVLLLAVGTFLGFTVWWLREFQVPPLVDIQHSVTPRYRPLTLSAPAITASSAWSVVATTATWTMKIE
jgi:hypothetical protein